MAKGLSAAKAKKMLEDGRVRGTALTEKQKKLFGAVAGGATPLKAINGGWLDKYQTGGSLPGASGMMYSRNSGSSAMSPPNLTKAQDGTEVEEKSVWGLVKEMAKVPGANISNLLGVMEIPANLIAEATESLTGRGDGEFNFMDAMPSFATPGSDDEIFTFTNQNGTPVKNVAGLEDAEGNPLVENPVGAFITNLVTDPSTYVGAGAVRNLVKKGAQKVTSKASKAIVKNQNRIFENFINDPANINNPFGFQRIGDAQPLSDLSLLTPKNIDLTKGFDNYAEELSKRERAYGIKHTDQNLSENFFKGKARVSNQLNENITPFGKALDSGMEGTVYEFANHPNSVLKYARNYSDKLTDINLPKGASFFRDNATAIPLKGEKFFDNFNKTEGAISLMDNLNKVGLDAPLNLSKRNAYADLLKRVRKMRDAGIQIDANNRSNIRFNKDKGVYDIFDLQSGKGNSSYMKWIDQQLRPGQMIPDKGSQFDFMYGGSLPKAQDGDKVMYGTPEYEAAYEEGRFADVPNPLDEVVIDSGVDYEKYPLYDDLSEQDRQYFKDDGPIGRGVRRRAQTKKGLAEDTYDVVNPIMYGMLGVAGGMMAGPSIATLGRAAAPYASRYLLNPIQRALSYKPLGGPVSIGNTIDAGSAAYAAYATPEAYDKFKENPSWDTGLDLGLTAMDLVPFSEIFTGGKNIRKAYNYASDAFTNTLKSNPSNYYRGIGQGGLDDVLETGLLRAKPSSTIPPNRMGTQFDFAKRFDNLYVTPRLNVANRYGKGVVAEIPKDAASFSSRYKNSDWSMMTNNQIPIEDINLYKKNFFGNYRPVEVPSSSLSDMPWIKPNIFPTNSPLSPTMEPYVSKKIYPFNKEQEVFESFLSTDKQLKNIDSKSLYYDQAGKPITKGEADNLLYPPEYQKNGGDVDKAQWGKILKTAKNLYKGFKSSSNVVEPILESGITARRLAGDQLYNTHRYSAQQLNQLLEESRAFLKNTPTEGYENSANFKDEVLRKIENLEPGIKKDLALQEIAKRSGRTVGDDTGTWMAKSYIDAPSNDQLGHVTTSNNLWDMVFKSDGKMIPYSNSETLYFNRGGEGQLARIRMMAPENQGGGINLIFDNNSLKKSGILPDTSGGELTISQDVSLKHLYPEAKVRAKDMLLNEAELRGVEVTDDLVKSIDDYLQINKNKEGGSTPKAQYGLNEKFALPFRDGVLNIEDDQGKVIGESSHIMKTETDGKGNWFSFPTLFQDEDGTWVDMSEQAKQKWEPVYEEAKKRGEVIDFGTDEKGALEFGEGSWKSKMKHGGGVPKAQFGWLNKLYKMYKGTDKVVDAASTTGKLKYMDELSSKAKKDVYEQNYEALTKTDKETRNLGKPHIAQEEYGEGWKYSDQVDFNNPEEVAAHRKRWIASQKKGNLINDNRRFPFSDETSDIFSDLSRKDLSGSIRDGLSKRFGTIGNTYTTGYGHRGLDYETNYLNDYFKDYKVGLPDGSTVPYGKLDGSVEIDPSSFNSSDEVMEELRRLAQIRMGDQFNNAFEKTSRIDFGDLLKNKNRNGGWLSKYENGGVIEDDRGQWAHPGKVTKINSNNITMKGVNYPVLGVSDTGDTKMMQPGVDNYKYDGNSVTEYPMAKDGKSLVELDQLTNFTNYNTPQPGGWLDKY